MALATQATKVWQDDDIRYRILLAVPEAKNIPYFAVGIEANRRRRVETEILSSKDNLSGLVSGNVFRKLQGRDDDHVLIRVRRRVLQNTAVYSSWLAFPILENAQTFAREHPRFGLEAISARSEAERSSKLRKLEEATAQRRYDLSSLKDQAARLWRAKEYVRDAEVIDKLAWDRWALSKLREDLDAVPEGVSVG